MTNVGQHYRLGHMVRITNPPAGIEHNVGPFDRLTKASDWANDTLPANVKWTIETIQVYLYW